MLPQNFFGGFGFETLHPNPNPNPNPKPFCKVTFRWRVATSHVQNAPSAGMDTGKINLYKTRFAGVSRERFRARIAQRSGGKYAGKLRSLKAFTGYPYESGFASLPRGILNVRRGYTPSVGHFAEDRCYGRGKFKLFSDISRSLEVIA